MGIVTQAALTSLRTLKYGSDTPGGGNSGEPYITQKIPPAFEQQVPSTNIWNSDNGLIRGGFTGATRASGLDALRIGKFLVDPPRGPLFIAKQVGLQLSNPQLETRTDALGQLLGSVGPTRIYNLGINTLAQVPVNAFGGHIVRHGLSPVLNEGQTYSKVVVANDAIGTFGANNRLVLLKNKLQTYPDSNIAQYVGGPDSVDGIGTTTIRRTVNTLSNPQFNQYLQFNVPNTAAIVSLTNTQLRYSRPAPDVDYFLAQGVSEQYFNGNVGQILEFNNIATGSFAKKPSQIDQNVINYNPTARTYNKLKSTIDTQITGSRIGTAYIVEDENGDVEFPITFVYTGKSKYKGLQLAQYNLEARVGSGRQDQINLTPLYIDSAPPGTSVTIGGQPYNVRDLIKFRIEAVDNTTPNNSVWMVFRAYLKDLNDNPNPSYNTINYVGRGEPFYIYNGFSRDISFTFQVAALSEAEMQPMWQKLNYLMSTVMPDYDTTSNVMKGSYTKLTIGNYIYRQPGIIKSLNYKINNNTPWEIAIDDPEITGGSTMYELPQVMDVSITFAPIHNFLPRKFPEKYAGGETWKDLPAFVVDRDDPTNQNAWLTNIFNNGKNIPTNSTSTAIKK